MVTRGTQSGLNVAIFISALTVAGCGGGGASSGTPGSAVIPPNTVSQNPTAQNPTAAASQLIYLADFNGIFIYPTSANGNVAPSATIAGPNTKLNAPIGVAVDSHGNIYVSNEGEVGCIPSINVYAAGANGNVAPIHTISGPHTGLSAGAGIAIDSSDNIWEVTSGGGGTAPENAILEFAAGASGDASPLRRIRGSQTHLLSPTGIALDGSGNIYVTNVENSTNLSSVTVYAPNANGNVAPTAIIEGDKTGLFDPFGITVDSTGKIFVANPVSGTIPQNGSVTIYPAGANGNVAPIATIGGPVSTLFRPEGVALDSAGNIYISDEGTNNQLPSIDVFAAVSAPGVGPIRTITGSNTLITQPALLTVH